VRGDFSCSQPSCSPECPMALAGFGTAMSVHPVRGLVLIAATIIVSAI
jgi:hypothetical protein